MDSADRRGAAPNGRSHKRNSSSYFLPADNGIAWIVSVHRGCVSSNENQGAISFPRRCPSDSSYTDSNSKLRFAACLPYGKTSFFFTSCCATWNWKPYYAKRSLYFYVSLVKFSSRKIIILGGASKEKELKRKIPWHSGKRLQLGHSTPPTVACC
jgi:hypothetical protein